MGVSHERGGRGEDLAAQYYRRAGWTILHRNWRFHYKEIDLVVAREGVVAFVEVKMRSRSDWGDSLAAISPAKQRDLATAARGWISRYGRRYHTFRVDAVAIRRHGRRVEVEHVPDAWRV